MANKRWKKERSQREIKCSLWEKKLTMSEAVAGEGVGGGKGRSLLLVLLAQLGMGEIEIGDEVVLLLAEALLVDHLLVALGTGIGLSGSVVLDLC